MLEFVRSDRSTRADDGWSARDALAKLYTTEDAGRTLPSHGPAWDAAIEFGIDVTLLEHNLALTPTQRLQQLDEMLRLYASVRR